MSLPNLSGSNISSTFNRLLTVDSTGSVYDGTGSRQPITFDGNDVHVSGTLHAQSYVVSESVTTVTSGSTVFGNSDDDIHQLTGSFSLTGSITSNVTASGNISSSGTIYANDYGVDGYLALNTDGIAQGRVFSDADITGIQIGRNGSPSKNIELLGPVTASGNISSSGTVYANEVHTNHVKDIDDTGTEIDFSFGDQIKIKVNTVDYIRMRDTAQNFVSINDANSDIDFEVEGDNHLLFRTDAADHYVEASGSFTVTGNGHITASGNISASGDVYGSTFTGSEVILKGPDSTKLQSLGPYYTANSLSASVDRVYGPAHAIMLDSGDQYTKEGFYIFKDSPIVDLGTKLFEINKDGDTHTLGEFSGSSVKATHITASGDISASGLISAANFHVPGQGRISFDNDDTDDQFIKGLDHSIVIDGDDFVKLKADDHVTFIDNSNNAQVSIDGMAGHITASGNISASGTIRGTTITAATKFVGTELESGGDIELDAGGDIQLDAAGGQVSMKNAGTEYFRFNVDATPELDIVGDLIIDPSGRNVNVDGIIGSYLTPTYTNYAVAGTQGHGSGAQIVVFIQGTEFVPDKPNFANYKSNGMGAGKDIVGYFTYTIPAGYVAIGGCIISTFTSNPYNVYSGTMCSKTLRLEEQACKSCPSEETIEGWTNHVDDWSAVGSYFKADIPGNAVTFEVNIKTGTIVNGAAILLEPF